MDRVFVIAAGLLGALGVGFGAAAAHGLDRHLPPDAVQWVETASRYLIWHALALFGISISLRTRAWKGIHLSGILLLCGTIIFCGSLLILAFFNLQFIAMAAPIGGVTLIIGWLSLIVVGFLTEKLDKTQ